MGPKAHTSPRQTYSHYFKEKKLNPKKKQIKACGCSTTLKASMFPVVEHQFEGDGKGPKGWRERQQWC